MMLIIPGDINWNTRIFRFRDWNDQFCFINQVERISVYGVKGVILIVLLLLLLLLKFCKTNSSTQAST